MKFSLSWLKEHIDFLPDVKLNSIISGLTDLGLEVEKVDDSSNKLKDFIDLIFKSGGKHFISFI